MRTFSLASIDEQIDQCTTRLGHLNEVCDCGMNIYPDSMTPNSTYELLTELNELDKKVNDLSAEIVRLRLKRNEQRSERTVYFFNIAIKDYMRQEHSLVSYKLALYAKLRSIAAAETGAQDDSDVIEPGGSATTGILIESMEEFTPADKEVYKKPQPIRTLVTGPGELLTSPQVHDASMTLNVEVMTAVLGLFTILGGTGMVVGTGGGVVGQATAMIEMVNVATALADAMLAPAGGTEGAAALAGISSADGATTAAELTPAGQAAVVSISEACRGCCAQMLVNCGVSSAIPIKAFAFSMAILMLFSAGAVGMYVWTYFTKGDKNDDSVEVLKGAAANLQSSVDSFTKNLSRIEKSKKNGVDTVAKEGKVEVTDDKNVSTHAP